MPPKKQSKKAAATKAADQKKEAAAKAAEVKQSAQATTVASAQIEAQQQPVVEQPKAQAVPLQKQKSAEKAAPQQVSDQKVASPAKQASSNQQNQKEEKVVEAAHQTQTTNMAELTKEELINLRKARFGAQNAISSEDALNDLTEAKRKLQERAARFGIITQEVLDEKHKARRERFGIQTAESLEAKKQERMKRFGVQEKTGKAAKSNNRDSSGVRQVVTTEIDEERAKKLKERLERFGAVEEGDMKPRSVSHTGLSGKKRDRKHKQKKELVINKKLGEKKQGNKNGGPRPQGNRMNIVGGGPGKPNNNNKLGQNRPMKFKRPPFKKNMKHMPTSQKRQKTQ